MDLEEAGRQRDALTAGGPGLGKIHAAEELPAPDDRGEMPPAA